MFRLNFFHTHISEQAITRVVEVLRSGMLSEGKMVAQFEKELRSRLNLSNPVALNSGTSALHLGLLVAGVEPGDEVVLAAQTFVASGLAVLMCGAKPVFADIQLQTGNISPESFRSRLTNRTKAVMPIHWAGYPADLDEINEIARERDIAVLEDAAHAMGATYRGRPVGAISRFTAFSFQAIKHLTTGDGGALCCIDQRDFNEARRRRWFGIDRVSDLTGPLGEREYNLEEIGFKYHLNDVGAAIGLGNLSDFGARLARRQAVNAHYRSELANISGLTLLESKDDRQSACWLFTVLVDRRLDFISSLRSRGIPASVVHQRIDRNRVFRQLDSSLPNQTTFDEHQVSLPVHEGLTDDAVTAVISAVRAGW